MSNFPKTPSNESSSIKNPTSKSISKTFISNLLKSSKNYNKFENQNEETISFFDPVVMTKSYNYSSNKFNTTNFRSNIMNNNKNYNNIENRNPHQPAKCIYTYKFIAAPPKDQQKNLAERSRYMCKSITAHVAEEYGINANVFTTGNTSSITNRPITETGEISRFIYQNEFGNNLIDNNNNNQNDKIYMSRSIAKHNRRYPNVILETTDYNIDSNLKNLNGFFVWYSFEEEEFHLFVLVIREKKNVDINENKNVIGSSRDNRFNNNKNPAFPSHIRNHSYTYSSFEKFPNDCFSKLKTESKYKNQITSRHKKNHSLPVASTSTTSTFTTTVSPTATATTTANAFNYNKIKEDKTFIETETEGPLLVYHVKNSGRFRSTYDENFEQFQYCFPELAAVTQSIKFIPVPAAYFLSPCDDDDNDDNGNGNGNGNGDDDDFEHTLTEALMNTNINLTTDIFQNDLPETSSSDISFSSSSSSSCCSSTSSFLFNEMEPVITGMSTTTSSSASTISTITGTTEKSDLCDRVPIYKPEYMALLRPNPGYHPVFERSYMISEMGSAEQIYKKI